MDDYELEDRRLKPPVNRGPWIAVGVVAIAVAALVVYLTLRQREAPEVAAVAPEPAPAAPTSTVTAEAEAVPPPGAVDGETLLKRLAAGASSSETLRGWASVDGIFQRLAAAARFVADGKSPRPMLSFIELPGRYEVQEEGSGENEKFYVDPSTYGRYDGLATAVASVDPARCGAAYRQLRPYFNALYKQIAAPGERFDAVLSAALQRLLSVRVPQGRLELIPKGAIYTYADPELEALTPAAKHMMRMGPRNAAKVQDALYGCAESAGLPLRR